MAKQASTKLEQHPLAQQYAPGTMSDEEFEALRADIIKREQQHPIVTYEGKILDGLHRYRVCVEENIEPIFKKYEGKDPEGMVIALNVLRRKLGATQRAVAGAHLNLEMGISQDEASKRVGVAKLHINIVVQILKSKNARLIKMLEQPDITRERLYEEAVDANIMPGSVRKTMASTESIASGAEGLDAYFRGQPVGTGDDDDLIGDGGGSTEPDLDHVLGAPPTAGGKVLGKKDTSAGGAVIGTKRQHPERRSVETPASKLSSAFRGLTQADQIDFVKFSWTLLSKAILASGVAMPADPAQAAVATSKAIAKAKGSAKAATKTALRGKRPQRAPSNRATVA